MVGATLPSLAPLGLVDEVELVELVELLELFELLELLELLAIGPLELVELDVELFWRGNGEGGVTFPSGTRFGTDGASVGSVNGGGGSG